MLRLHEPLSAIVPADEYAAVILLRGRLGLDVARTHQFWEAIVATNVAGRQTARSCPWDVELDHYDGAIRIEVKFSQEFECTFREGTRPVFKWALPRGGGAPKPSHVTVFIGIDERDSVHCWVVPTAAVPQVASVTVTSPRARTGSTRSGLESWQTPPGGVLPAVLDSWRCHLSYDRDHHAATRAATLAATKGS